DTTGSANNDFLGDQVVEGVFPDGDGASTDFTPTGGGSHYTQVDDPATALNSADYVQSDTVGHKDYFTFADLTFIEGGINGVAAVVAASLDSLGSRTMRVRFRNSGGTEYSSAGAKTIADTAVAEQLTLFEEEPVGAAAWTPSDLNG